MPTITHTYSPAMTSSWSSEAERVTFVPLTLQSGGGVGVGTRVTALIAADGALSVNLPVGAFRVEHTWLTRHAIPAGWDGARYVDITADASLVSMTPYLTADDLRRALIAAPEVSAAIVGDDVTVSGRLIASTSTTPAGLQAGDFVLVVPTP